MRHLRTTGLAGVAALAGVVPVAFATAASSNPPTATTAAATSPSSSAGTLNGSVNPNGNDTSYAFQWGPTTGYGHETALTSVGAGTSAVDEHAALTGLDAGTTYHFRVIAISSAGTSVGADKTLTTTGTAPAPSPAPIVTTGTATSVGTQASTVTGTVTASGQPTTYYVEYGPTVNYGYQTAPQSAPAVAVAQPVSVRLSDHLTPGTTFHYRLVAVNAGGTALGADGSFTTPRSGAAPLATTAGATNVKPTSARLNGTINPEGQATTYYFQYGTTGAYGLQTAPKSGGSGHGSVSVHANVANLTTGQTYHFRLVATSAGGTTYGADKVLSAAASTSHVAFMGRMGFVSPGRVIGVEAGCFGGTTPCTGHVTMSTSDGIVIGQRNFNIKPNSGGFQNMQISRAGEALVRENHVHHLLPVTVKITTSHGTITQVTRLGRWVWH